MKIEPFKPLTGAKFKLDDEGRSVAVYPGEDGTYAIIWENKKHVTSVRLTREAAIATAGLLTTLVGNGVDAGAPPLV